MKKFAAAFFILILSSQFFAQTAEIHTKIITAVADRNYAAAINELQSIEAKEPAIFKLNNYNYLLGRISEKNGDHAAAMAAYEKTVSGDSILKEYALWHLARLARISGNLMLERTYLQELIVFSPKSLLNAAAKNRLARSWYDSKNYDLAIKALGEQLAASTAVNTNSRNVETSVARENRLFLARSYMNSGDAAAARANFTMLVEKAANPAQPDDFSLESAKALDLLDVGQEKFGKSAPSLTDYEHLRRAQIYQFNRDFDDARLHYSAIINNFPGGGNVPDAIYQIGRGYVQQADFTEAIKWFERVQEQFPDHPVCKDALLQAASAYARVGKFKESVSRYQHFIEKYPEDERLDRAYLNIVDVLRDQGEEVDALKWAVKTQDAFKDKVPAAIALFGEAKIYLTRSDWPNALAKLDKLLTLSDLGGVNVPGATNTAEITFLRGFVLENMRRYGEAVDVYLSIPDGRAEYYGGRATERLLQLARDEAAKPVINAKLASLSVDIDSKDPETQRKNLQSALRLTEPEAARLKLLETLKKAYANLPAYKKVPEFKLIESGRKDVLQKPASPSADINKNLANELLFLGLYDEAAPELEASIKANSATAANRVPSDIDYTLAVFYDRGDMANRAVAFAEPLWRAVPADYQIELLPRAQMELLYPAPYRDAFAKHSPQRGVDPRFLLSIMRQESRYRADVKSYAAARGLMQFISTTSDKIARELRRDDFRQDELYDPSTAILFGSQYTANLFKLFPNEPQAVAASYNGGEDNMKRWKKRSISEIADSYVPEIAFSQSKDYVYKVMANYRVYQIFYDESLKLK